MSIEENRTTLVDFDSKSRKNSIESLNDACISEMIQMPSETDVVNQNDDIEENNIDKQIITPEEEKKTDDEDLNSDETEFATSRKYVGGYGRYIPTNMSMEESRATLTDFDSKSGKNNIESLKDPCISEMIQMPSKTDVVNQNDDIEQNNIEKQIITPEEEKKTDDQDPNSDETEFAASRKYVGEYGKYIPTNMSMEESRATLTDFDSKSRKNSIESLNDACISEMIQMPSETDVVNQNDDIEENNIDKQIITPEEEKKTDDEDPNSDETEFANSRKYVRGYGRCIPTNISMEESTATLTDFDSKSRKNSIESLKDPCISEMIQMPSETDVVNQNDDIEKNNIEKQIITPEEEKKTDDQDPNSDETEFATSRKYVGGYDRDIPTNMSMEESTVTLTDFDSKSRKTSIESLKDPCISEMIQMPSETDVVNQNDDIEQNNIEKQIIIPEEEKKTDDQDPNSDEIEFATSRRYVGGYDRYSRTSRKQNKATSAHRKTKTTWYISTNMSMEENRATLTDFESKSRKNGIESLKDPCISEMIQMPSEADVVNQNDDIEQNNIEKQTITPKAEKKTGNQDPIIDNAKFATSRKYVRGCAKIVLKNKVNLNEENNNVHLVRESLMTTQHLHFQKNSKGSIFDTQIFPSKTLKPYHYHHLLKTLEHEGLDVKEYLSVVDSTTEDLTNNQVNLLDNNHSVDEDLPRIHLKDKDKMFHKRSGTTNKGHLFEDYMVAYVTLNLLLDNKVVNFDISANDKSYGSMDDIVLDLNLADGTTQKYAMQLKYSNTKKAILTEASLLNSKNNKSVQNQETKGHFNISSYFKDYEKVSSSVGPFKFILCTNRSFGKDESKSNNMVIEDGTDKITIRILNTKLEPEALACQNLNGTNCKYHKFEIVDDGCESNNVDKYKTFFENFILITDYISVEELEEEMKQTFQKNFCHKDDAYLSYLHYVKKWSAKQGKKTKLHTNLISEVLALLILSDHIVPFMFPKYQNEMCDNEKLLKTAISNFKVTLVDKRYLDKVKKLYSTTLSDLPDIKNLHQETYNHDLIQSSVRNVDSLTEEALTKALWLLGISPLIVNDNEDIRRAVTLCRNKFLKFIVLTEDSSCGGPWSDVFLDMSDLKNESCEIYNNVLTNFRYIFQGKQIFLKTLTEVLGSTLPKLITPSELICLADDSLSFDQTNEELPPSYISRYLSRSVINPEFLKQVPDDVFILISCYNDDHLIEDFNFKTVDVKHLSNDDLKIECNSTIIYISEDEFDVEKLSHFLHKEKFHHFRLFENSKLEWIKSNDDVTNLKKYQLERCYIHESELIKLESGNNINIICGDSGIGKTSLMKSVQYQISPVTYWTILIISKNHFQHFRDNQQGDAEKFKEHIFNQTCQNLTEFETNILKMFMTKKLVRYIFDGLDELSSENFEVIKIIINQLSKEGHKLWLNCRNNLRDNLEKEYTVIAKSIRKFEKEDQEVYVQRRLKNFSNVPNKTRLERFWKHDFLEIPLQIFILTELLLRDSKTYDFLFDDTFTVPDLYKYFINVKFALYYKEKLNLDYLSNDQIFQKIEKEKTERISNYEKVAALKYFESFISPETRYDGRKFLSEIFGQDDLGIIIKVTQDNTVEFFHSSFGEYFAVSYLVKNFQELHLFQNIIFADDHIRYFFDLIVSNPSKAHKAVMSKDLELLRSCTEEELKMKDQTGRIPLHIACTYGTKYPLLRVEKKDEIVIIDDRAVYWQELKPETLDYKEMVMHLLKHNDPTEVDHFGLDCLQYASKNNCFYALSLLIDNRSEDTFLNNVERFLTVLYYCVRFDYDEVFDKIEQVPFIKSRHFNESIIFVAAFYNAGNSLRKILEKDGNGVYRQIIQENGEKLLKRVLSNGNFEIMNMLIEHGAPMKTIIDNSGGKSVLNRATMFL